MLLLYCLLFLSSALGISSSYVSDACSNKAVPYAFVYPGYCAFIWYSNATVPRGIRVASNNDVLYLESYTATIKVLWENEDGIVQEGVLWSGDGLNHALYIYGDYLYASSTSTVYRWPYTPGNRTTLNSKQVVVRGLPCCSDHKTRSLEFDSAGLMYVHSGAASNVDPNPLKAMIRRFNITKIPKSGIHWNSGAIHAYGLRNEVGIRFDQNGILWGVENGRDDLRRADIGNVEQNNPSEEMNKFATHGLFYGYPYCWSEYNLTSTPDYPTGTQWADAMFWKDGQHTDVWCRNTSNVVPPVFNFEGHKAPLDLIFNHGDHSFVPYIPDGDAFVAFHGSSRRAIPVGYEVSLMQITNNLPVSETPFFAYEGPGATGPNWPYRPVGLAFNKCGGQYPCLMLTTGTRADTPGEGTIIAIVRNS